MTQLRQVYKCSVCGNIVEILHTGVGELVCCQQPMELLQEKVKEEGYEKHIPVVEETEEGVRVRVGSVPHPMDGDHYIEWVELIAEGKVHRQFLHSGDEPEVAFTIAVKDAQARVYCNLHGLWRSQ